MSTYLVPDEQSMLDLGRQLSALIQPGSIVFFNGELGAGKTTLVRGILSGFGCEAVITSPTYTLVESYIARDFEVCHLDLYRLQNSFELEMLGFRDLLDGDSVCLIEWPERGRDLLPEPSAVANISMAGNGRVVEFHCGGIL